MFLRKFGREVPSSNGVDKRVKGIEPSCAAWEAAVLPLNYTRIGILDFRFSIADCKLNNWQSLPGNHVVGRIEICALSLILAQRPADHAEV